MTDGHDDRDVFGRERSVVARQRELISRGPIVAVNRPEPEDEGRDQERHEPGPVGELGDGEDTGGEARGHRPQADPVRIEVHAHRIRRAVVEQRVRRTRITRSLGRSGRPLQLRRRR